MPQPLQPLRYHALKKEQEMPPDWIHTSLSRRFATMRLERALNAILVFELNPDRVIALRPRMLGPLEKVGAVGEALVSDVPAWYVLQ